MQVRVTATDESQASAAGVFDLAVQPVAAAGDSGETVSEAPPAERAERSAGDQPDDGLPGARDVLPDAVPIVAPGGNSGERGESASGAAASAPDAFEALLAQLSHYPLEPDAGDWSFRSRHSELSALEIARRWDLIARHNEWLALQQDEDARQGAALDWQLEQALAGAGEFGGGMAHAGIAGVGHGAADLQALHGLAEGWAQLRA
jgi:hypothetical protein